MVSARVCLQQGFKKITRKFGVTPPIRSYTFVRYEEKLAELGLPSLQARRTEIDMVQTYKIVNNLDTGNSDQWFERANNRRATRNNTVRHNLVPKQGQHKFRRNFFSSRVIMTWKSLPKAVRDALTVSSFKRQYRRHLEGTVAPATRNT